MRALVFTAVAGLALAAATAAGGAPVGGADVATGHGTAVACPEGPPPPPGLPSCGLSTRDFHLAATSTLAGGRAAGFYEHTDAAGRLFRGRVTCVTAVGNAAVIGGTLDQRVTVPGDQLPPDVTRFAVWVVDNDDGDDPAPDLISPIFFYTDEELLQAEGQCLLPPVSPGYLTVVDGDIRVRDGQLAGGA